MPNANDDTKLHIKEDSKNPSVTVPQTGKKLADARRDPEQQKHNREDLHVGEDHRTDKMREDNRNTYP